MDLCLDPGFPPIARWHRRVLIATSVHKLSLHSVTSVGYRKPRHHNTQKNLRQTRDHMLKFLTRQHDLLWFAKTHTPYMRNRSMKPLTSVVLILSMGISLSLDQEAAHAQHADMVRYGEPAVTFANGVIQKVTPRDGIVNLITGDNQSSGNRMLLARRGCSLPQARSPG
jgi:hypothetical protein